MKRPKLSRLLYERLGDVSAEEAERLVALVFGVMTDALTRGERVVIRDFGKFLLVEAKARMNHDLCSDTFIRVEARRLLSFRTSPSLKHLLNPLVEEPREQAQTKNDTALVILFFETRPEGVWKLRPIKQPKF